MMERANQSYREKQYEQHHHLQDKATAAATTTTAAASSSSTNVNKNPSWDKYKTTLHKHTQTQAEHNKTSDKLQIMKNLVTWEDYKHLVTELQVKKEECSKLQEKVDSLTRLVDVERTVNRSSYRTAVPPVVGEDDNSDSNPFGSSFDSAALHSISQREWESESQQQTFDWNKVSDPVVINDDEPCDDESVNLPETFWLDTCSFSV